MFKCKRNKFVILLLIFTFYFVRMEGASLPKTSYVSTTNELSEADIANMSQEEQNQFFAQNPQLSPMLGDAPVLPPDPGEETPVGDFIPLIFGGLAYFIIKIRKTKLLNVYLLE
jgi:hypothetical protein